MWVLWVWKRGEEQSARVRLGSSVTVLENGISPGISVGNLPAERDLFDSYHLPKTDSDRAWELEICQGEGVCC